MLCSLQAIILIYNNTHKLILEYKYFISSGKIVNLLKDIGKNVFFRYHTVKYSQLDLSQIMSIIQQ